MEEERIGANRAIKKSPFSTIVGYFGVEHATTPEIVQRANERNQSTVLEHLIRIFDILIHGMDDQNADSIHLELCTDSCEDWKTFLDLCCKGFQDTPSFKNSHPDPGKRRKFLSEYFKYIYETELSGGRAGLACAKRTNDKGQTEIVYATSASYNRKRPTTADISAEMKTFAKAAEASLSEVNGCEEVVHEKIRQFSKKLNFDYTYGNYHVIAEKCRGMGLSRKFFAPAVQLMHDDGMARGILSRDKPLLSYGIVDDVRQRRRQALYHVIEVAHLHEKRLDGQKPICVDDRNASQTSPDDFDCVFVYAGQHAGSPNLIPKIKQLFSLSSNL